jgi:hypothetical protein
MDLKAFPLSTKTFLVIIALIITFGSVQAVRELIKVTELRQQNPFVFAGEAFAGAKSIIKDEKHVSYITDKDLAADKNIAEFSQAQFSLAPVILDLNNPNHRFLIINCDSPQRAKAVLQYYKARPVRQNNLGVILAVREGL